MYKYTFIGMCMFVHVEYGGRIYMCMYWVD